MTCDGDTVIAMMAPRASRERGFTLIEVMIVVALIAVLAAMVIPSFFTEAQRSKSDAEVSAMFAELRIREESYKVERGTYLSTGTGETDGFPASPTNAPQTIQGSLPTEWVQLRFAPPQPSVYCSYVAIAGDADDTPGTEAQSFGMPADPAVSWYYLLATCDMDGNTGTNATYFTSSYDTRIQDRNSGH
jgi:prepilin-type N-terminal cleavage/methylation domain-containing protein